VYSYDGKITTSKYYQLKIKAEMLEWPYSRGVFYVDQYKEGSMDEVRASMDEVRAFYGSDAVFTCLKYPWRFQQLGFISFTFFNKTTPTGNNWMTDYSQYESRTATHFTVSVSAFVILFVFGIHAIYDFR
jgi:hypothetical protein